MSNEELKYVSEQSFEKENTKKILGKNSWIGREMKNKTRIPKDLIFFDFSKTLKTNKDRILKL